MKQVEKYTKYQPYLDFIERYKNADNAADGSERDANANVENKNITTMEGELFKGDFIGVNRLAMWQKIKELYDEGLAEEYLRQLEEHEIYRHDETALKPYCVSITMYPFLFGGITSIGGLSDAPTNIHSYTGGIINLVFAIASQFAGAVSTPEFLPYFDYFLRKEYGDDYYLRADEVVDLSLKKRTIRKVVEDLFQQAVYSLNQPAAARNFQSVFWNIAYYDEPYFKGLFQDFVFPDGSPMIWESTSWLQETFMNWFNEERKKKILTFPVESISLLHNGKEFMDPYWKEKTAEMWAKGHSFFCYTSDSVDSLSSCCFSPDTKVLAKSSSGVFFGPIRDLHNMKYTGNKENLCVYHNGSWASAKTIKLPARPMYSIKTANGKTVCATDNHLFPTLRGDVPAESLTTDDYLLFNTLALDAVPEKDEKLSYNQGFLIGMYLGDGSIDAHGPYQKSVMFSLNKEKFQSCISYMNEALSEIVHGEKFSVYKIVNNVVPVSYYGDILADFIQRFVSGRYANEKHLLPETFLQSQLFRKGILDGFYATDGGNSNRIYTTSQKLSEDIECLCATLGLNTSVSITDRTDEPVVIRGETYSRNFPLYCIRWYSPKNKRSMKGIFRIVNNGMYFRVTDIRPVEDYPHDSVYCFEMDNQDEPYFTLPNGMITHNCRLRNEMQKNTFSFTLGAGGVSTGSKCVMTMNINRLVQNAIRDNIPIEEAVAAQTEKLHKYLLAFNEILKENLVKHMLPIYEAGFISFDKQYLTIGINGFVEGAEFLGIEIAPDNPEYISYGEKILKPIYLLNKRDKDPQNGIMFNTEFVPAENLGVKFAKWDKRDGYFVPRDCYNSYFYLVEDETKNVLDKFKMSGKQFTQYLDGGSAYHCNLSEHLSKDQYLKMLDAAMVTGCPYFTFNIPNTICNDCGHIDKHCLNECPACGSKNLDYATRVIGYLKRVSCFSKARREEAKKRAYIHG